MQHGVALSASRGTQRSSEVVHTYVVILQRIRMKVQKHMHGRRPDPSFSSPGTPGDALLGAAGAVLSKYCKQLSRVPTMFPSSNVQCEVSLASSLVRFSGSEGRKRKLI